MKLASRGNSRSRLRNPSRASLAAFFTSLLLATASTVGQATEADDALWKLWPAPWGGREVLDQHQVEAASGSHLSVSPGKPLGQTFVPTATSLARLDLRIGNEHDGRPGRIQLWEWRGSRPRTVASAPLWSDVIELDGREDFVVRSLFPGIVLRAGRPYYFELSGEGRGPFRVKHAGQGTNPYARGEVLREDKRGIAGMDLWFRTYAAPAPPATAASSQRTPAPIPIDPEPLWVAPQRAPGPVTRDDYLTRIARFARYTRPDSLRNCTQTLGGKALREAFLYRASCEQGACKEARARTARDILRAAYSWRFCKAEVHPLGNGCLGKCAPEEARTGAWIARPGVAWQWIKDSPSITPADRARLRQLMSNVAEASFERREFGTLNRSMYDAAGFRLAAKLDPQHPSATKWRGYSESILDAFFRDGDGREDSSSYELGVFLPALLLHARIAGIEDRLWKDPRFLAMVERAYDQTFALGVQADYGDSAGWALETGSIVWLFESAATRLRDGRYRWLAHRVFDYHRRHIRDDPPRDESLQTSLEWLTFAYLDADESITPVAPDSLHEVELVLASAGAGDVTIRPGAAHTRELAIGAGRLAGLDLQVEAATAGKLRIELVDARQRVVYSELRDFGAGGGVLKIRPLFALQEQRQLKLRLSSDTSLALRAATAGADWLRVLDLAGEGSTVTRRRSGSFVPPADRKAEESTFRFDGGETASKVVLRSGHGREDLAAMFNLLRAYSHGQEERGALVGLIDGGALLLQDTPTPYWFHARRPEDESAPFVRRYSGGKATEPGQHATVSAFIDARAATLAEFEWEDPSGWQTQITRRVLFVKNRFLVVRDRIRFPSDVLASAGAVWHVDRFLGSAGHGVDTGHPFPQSNLWLARNPKRHLWLQMVPRPARTFEAWTEAKYLPAPVCPVEGTSLRLRAECRSGPARMAAQKWSGLAKAGEEQWFDTVLLPHSGRDDAAALHSRVSVVRAARAELALEIAVGDERWIVVDRPGASGSIAVADGVSTDAETLVARTGGSSPYFLSIGASRLELEGVARSWLTRSVVEEGAERAPGRQEAW